MHASALRIELRIPQARSLKAKRGVLRPLLDDVRRTFGVSVAEVGFQDQWQRSTVGVALVSGHHAELLKQAGAIRRRIEHRDDVEVLEVAMSYLEES
ncbi:hypothetical protein BMS3Abin02_00369 [bacterium BMS3Abin02]|nr:hypothetical protein BMS3Abin02_00369 [bacterium BMS3Abin02]GBE21567.1 hypothetical protein BMS3Bbin01_00912 [bacterium BMS3Bbin01]HDH26256.1 DUF503 domain-containing protein [Actinomycetota bacterium]HDL49266.1 DUF503 domain-containing protein [Actinomycetota bacterium]